MTAPLYRKIGETWLGFRLKAAWVAFKTRGAYIVIYDTPDHDGISDAGEQYYGYFVTREQAIECFETAFPPGTAHNAYLCRIIEPIRVGEPHDLS